MSVKIAHELKELQTRKSRLEVECKELLEDSRRANKKYCEANEKLKAITKRISELDGDNNIIVTEHAILRYLERKYELNLEEIRKEILSDKNEEAIKTLGSGKYPIGNGYKAVVKGRTIVSVI